MNERVFISTQLACMLQPTVFKVLFYITQWQKQPQFKYYPNQMSKMLHLTQEEIELAIQTLIDRKLLSATNIDGKWILQLEKQQIDKYLKVTLEKVHDSEVFPMATKITWNATEEQPKTNSIEDMSTKDIQTMILRLQASLNERQQTKKKIVSMQKDDEEDDDLPF